MPNSFYLSFRCAALATREDTVRQFSGVANSGRPFMYEGKAAIVDLSDIAFKDKTPALIDHDRARRVGVAVLSVSAKGLEIHGTLLSNEHGKQIAADADEGFPWELSAHLQPRKIEQLAKGQSAKVNEQTVTGPMMILRHNTVREVSFTPTGVDSATAAVILADDHSPNPITGESSMTLEEALAEIAKLKAKIADLERDNEKAAGDKADIEAQLADLQSDLHTKSVDAKLSEAGFKRSDDGKSFTGISEVTYKLLLSSDIKDSEAMIADLAPKAKATAPDALFEETSASADEGVKLSDNPIVANAKARAKGENYYV